MKNTRKELELKIDKLENLKNQFQMIMNDLFDVEDDSLSRTNLEDMFFYSTSAFAGVPSAAPTKDAYFDLLCTKSNNNSYLVSDLIDFSDDKVNDLDNQINSHEIEIDKFEEIENEKLRAERISKMNNEELDKLNQFKKDLQDKEDRKVKLLESHYLKNSEYIKISEEIFNRKICINNDDFANYSNKDLKKLSKELETQVQDLKRSISEINKEIKNIIDKM